MCVWLYICEIVYGIFANIYDRLFDNNTKSDQTHL